MAKFQHPVIVLPGMTATTLHDDYPRATEDVWTMIMNKEFERLQMHPDNARYEAVEPSHVIPGRLFGAIYTDLIDALRYDLTDRADRPTPVFAFPYDWRHDLKETANRLHDFVEEVIARTQLLRHYKGYQDNPKVDLVGHSMGGLVICEYVAKYGGKNRVRKVATLGTPYQGSIEAVVKLLTGMGNLSGSVPSAREREAARSLPAIYQLLPSYRGAVVAAASSGGAVEVKTDLFDADAWQPGIVESLGEFIRMHAVDPPPKAKRPAAAKKMLTKLLELAKGHRRRVGKMKFDGTGLTQDDWLAIVGANSETRVQIVIRRDGEGNPRFSASTDDFVNQWTVGDPWKTGDGTAPLPGALPEFLDNERLVVVTPEDFDFWEIKDRAAFGVVGFHALLPNLNLCQRLVIKHLRPKFTGEVWGRSVPGVTGEEWKKIHPRLKYME